MNPIALYTYDLDECRFSANEKLKINYTAPSITQPETMLVNVAHSSSNIQLSKVPGRLYEDRLKHKLLIWYSEPNLEQALESFSHYILDRIPVTIKTSKAFTLNVVQGYFNSQNES